MSAEEFVLQHFPEAFSYKMLDDDYRSESYVIFIDRRDTGIFKNKKAKTEREAWANAKQQIEESHTEPTNRH